MRKRNKVAQLQRTHSHRKAMLGNMVQSLFFHERIQTTTAKAKAARQLAEKLITRAKMNAGAPDEAAKVHNIRQAHKVIKNPEILDKLFNDIAARFSARSGGYTRVVRIGRRISDASEMAVLELVDRKELVQLKEERKEKRAAIKGGKKDKAAPKAAKTEAKPDKKADKKAKKDDKKKK